MLRMLDLLQLKPVLGVCIHNHWGAGVQCAAALTDVRLESDPHAYTRAKILLAASEIPCT